MSQLHRFCTLFDSNYLTRALVLYESLHATGEAFVLYAVCFDSLSHSILGDLNLPALVRISLAEFETESLLKVKPTRKPGEYCWTCTPHVIWPSGAAMC